MKSFASLTDILGSVKPTTDFSHRANLDAVREVWTPQGRLVLWDGNQRLGTTGAESHEAMMELYKKFGEECAERNVLPNYQLFASWLHSEREAAAGV